MIFVSIEDFYEHAALCHVMNRKEEVASAMRMKEGDITARDQLIQSYIPMVAGHIKHMKPQLQQFGLVIHCLQALEEAVDSFDFSQESETFPHRLSWWLRQATVEYITRR